jgi:alkylation response protein AidB-like acyl-CoA dehydrogenase
MMPEERRMLGEMATDLIQSGRASTFVDELIDSGMADEVWADHEAVAIVFDAHGRAGATSTLLDHAALQATTAVPGQLVLPAFGSARAPGASSEADIVVEGLVLAAEDDPALVVGLEDGRVVLVASGAVTVEPVVGFDADLRVARVTGKVPSSSTQAIDGAAWNALAARAARALAFELLGLASAALDCAVKHVMERHQFGRPLAAFQVVRHRLADAAIARAGAEELARAYGPELSVEETVLVVKAAAGRAALLAVQQAQQVCGGMGFTEEFGLHRLVRRAYLLDSLFGGCESAEVDLGRLAINSARLPGPALAL